MRARQHLQEATRRARRAGGVAAREDGGVGLLGIGLSVGVGMLLVGGVSVSSAQMARVDILDAADHASAAAADRISLAHVYEAGVDGTRLDQGQAAVEAARVLAQAPKPPHVAAWHVTGVTVVGERVEVRVAATVTPPVIGTAMSVLGAPLDVSVTAHADAHLQR